MRLFYTTTSPYARVTRVALAEKGITNIDGQLNASDVCIDQHVRECAPVAVGPFRVRITPDIDRA